MQATAHNTYKWIVVYQGRLFEQSCFDQSFDQEESTESRLFRARHFCSFLLFEAWKARQSDNDVLADGLEIFAGVDSLSQANGSSCRLPRVAFGNSLHAGKLEIA